MVEYGDWTRTQAKVCEIFNEKYPERPTSRSIVSKTEKMFRDFSHVRDNYKTNQRPISENT